MCRIIISAWVWLLIVGIPIVQGNPPVAQYIFPAGGQRGKTVEVRVGGLFLHHQCFFEMTGTGIEAEKILHRTKTTWFEGPLLPLPESQQAEDYPKDMAGRIQIQSNCPLGTSGWRLWTSQGASSGPIKFMVGDLPEIVEQEIEGDPVPVQVTLPVTINGRIFPRGNVDIWMIEARQGESITCEVHAARLGSPLDSRLEVIDPRGNRIAENDDYFGADSLIQFSAPVSGKYQVRIHDVNFRGGQAYVYRLTITAHPHVIRVYPLGGRRASTIPVELQGQGVPREAVEINIPAESAPEYFHRLVFNNKKTNPFLLQTDELPEYLETEPNDSSDQVKPVEVPAILNGRIHPAGDVDYWGVLLKKGASYNFDLRAQVLGSPLHAILTLWDQRGKELAKSENLAQPKIDPFLSFTASADGIYFLRVVDAFRSRGGPEYAYRLRITSSQNPDFRIRFPEDTLILNRGGQAKLKLAVERCGAPGPIQLAVEGLPAGVTVPDLQIGAGQGAKDIVFQADKSAPIRVGRITIHGTMKVGEKTLTTTATHLGSGRQSSVTTVLVAIGLPTPFKITGKYDMRWGSRGTVFHRRYQIDRGGYNGPLEISVAERQARHLQGVTGPLIRVGAETNEFDYSIQLPPWMEMGRTCRVCVMATGLVKDVDGTEHVVSFSSIQVNEQMILVVEPGKLEVETDPSSFVSSPGNQVKVRVRITRSKSLKGPVELSLLRGDHLHSLSARPVIIPEQQNSAEFTIQLGRDLKGPVNQPVKIRATLLDAGEPIIAETPVEILFKE